ncbi:ferritin family protein [Laceyella putida]|uniref:Ferritin family protein n=2 Tax=Laceyella putida TaxID=110101 RepID=A0ABW2RPP4_9BACL
MNYFYQSSVMRPMIHANGNMYQTNPAYAIPLLKEAVKDERTDELFYDYLIQHAPSQEDREVITSIRNDERKHRRMFREMYYSLTGQTIEGDEYEPFTPPASYLEGLRRAIFGESGAVELYRKIYFTIPRKAFKNMVFEIMTDELKHGIRYNYLYAKNK